jgi:hypothetical protein
VGFQAHKVRVGGRVVAVLFRSVTHESQITATCPNGNPVGVVEEHPLGGGASGAPSGSPP